ncbi:MAG: M14 family metallopeptidase [Xanthomonadales bacterium]|nr:M14 family metallopeptidase [Xanthomonadales bacterium]
MRLLAFVSFWFASATLQAADFNYLPTDQDYDPSIPTPESVLGFQVGEWHVRHDQLVYYMERLAASSDRVTLEFNGRTHELRPKITVTITAPENFDQLEDLRQRHLSYTRGNSDRPGPLVLWFGYSIHGNEASGSNASLLFAYHLAASRDPALAEKLENTVILLDPSLNPDGMGRFAHWVNSNRSKRPVADRANREHQETWPGGRFNHYWFDLNRDWALLVHPESRARVKFQHHWRPHVITDFHEMGSDSTYFFQPGVPTRKNPLTPMENADITARLAEYHARYLDAIGQTYFTKERFDDFYYGKGSTYPDALGSIGILFEQGSVRGHLMATDYGEIPFSTAVRNQLTTSFSTLTGATELRDELLDYGRRFARETAELASRDPVQAYVFGDPRDPARTRELADRLLQHEIEIFELARPISNDDGEFRPGSALLVPTRQRNYRLLKSLFEDRTVFEDTTFYDVSAWNLARSFDLPFTALGREGRNRGEPYAGWPEPNGPELPDGAVAYGIDWDHYYAPRLLAQLQAAEVQVRVATDNLTARTAEGERRFQRGALIVPVKSNGGAAADIIERSGLPAVAITSGLANAGPDLGSPRLPPLKPVRPALVVGRGVSPTEAGEVWHLLDQRVELPLVMLDTHRLDEVDLEPYTHLLMVNGNYKRLGEPVVAKIRGWIKRGGILVASKRAAGWATKQGLHVSDKKDEKDEDKDKEKDEPKAPRAYADHDDDFSRTVIGGAIVRATVDTTHPMAYGYRRSELSVFRNGTTFLAPSDNPYESPLRYTDEPLISGYLGEERTRQLAGSAAVIASRVGAGSVIRLADNPNFRGFWFGTNRLYFNALFFGQVLERTPVPDTEERL